MTREEFDRILIEEGILSKKMRDDLWRDRPAVDLREEKLRKAAQKFKQAYPWACKEDF